MLSETEVKQLLFTEASASINPVFKRDITIETFVSFVRNKPAGYWLIRESRKEGMISITYKNHKVKENDLDVIHSRFLFVNDAWILVNNNSVIPYEKGEKTFQPMSSALEETYMSSLLALIFESYNLTYEHILLPKKNFESVNSSYLMKSPYIINTFRESHNIYGDPSPHLKKLSDDINIMRDHLCGISSMPTNVPPIDMSLLALIELPPRGELLSAIMERYPSESQMFTQFYDKFNQWLDKNNLLTPELYCPISLSLFIVPQYFIESGQVIDAESLRGRTINFCPITKKPIENAPTRINEYRGVLQECFDEFYMLVELYQEQQSKHILKKSSNHLFFESRNDDDKNKSSNASNCSQSEANLSMRREN